MARPAMTSPRMMRVRYRYGEDPAAVAADLTQDDVPELEYTAEKAEGWSGDETEAEWLRAVALAVSPKERRD